MREILFRGKRKDNGEWVEGYLCKKYYQELPHDRPVIKYKTTGNEHKWTPDYMVAEIDPSTVGQYTGLTDKNDKKIFEGDIVSFAGDLDFIDGKFVVVFDEFYRYMITAYKGNYLLARNNDDVEVIGNIHDNPELLKGGADDA